MGDPVSTVLGALGVAGLVTVCLDCFDIVQDGLNLGRDYILMEGRFSALRIRLFAWSKACGFMGESGPDPRLSNAAWRGHVQKQLNCICLLFMDAAKIVHKYDLVERHAQQAVPLGSPNAPFIDEGMHEFLRRIRRTKSRAGFLGALTWAVKDRKKFQELIDNLKEFIEALEMVAKNLHLFEAQQQSIQYEIESISDPSVLESIAATRIEETGIDTVSDIASQRLLELQSCSNQTQSIVQSHQDWTSSGPSEGETFLSAASHLPQENIPASIKGDPEDLVTQPRSSLENENLGAQQLGISDDSPDHAVGSHALRETDYTLVHNRLMMQGLIERYGKPSSQPIDLNDANYGALLQQWKGIMRLEPARDAADMIKSINPPGNYRLKRIYGELCKEPDDSHSVLSLVSVGELFVVLLTIEGPPHSPYRGGIFHLSVIYPSHYPLTPLKLRFLTPIYHPNIDDTGTVCMDSLDTFWSPVYHTRYIAISLLSLMSDPGLEDPLVPEIAALYVKDKPLYEKNAEAFTKMHATLNQSIPEYGVHPIDA